MRAVVGAGSNLGSRAAYLHAAAMLLGDAVRARSRVYETAPVGPPQPAYLNAAFLLEFDGSPEGLLDRLLAVETQLGRVRDVRWGPRTVDLDVLFVDDHEANSSRLTVPHPRLAERTFALAPLIDVAPYLVPRYGPTLERLGGPPPLFVGPDPGPEASLARAVNLWLGAGEGGQTHRIEAANAAEWVQKATELPGACQVAIEPMGPAGVGGTVLSDGSNRRLSGALRQEGRQVVVIAGPPKVG